MKNPTAIPHCPSCSCVVAAVACPVPVEAPAAALERVEAAAPSVEVVFEPVLPDPDLCAFEQHLRAGHRFRLEDVVNLGGGNG